MFNLAISDSGMLIYILTNISCVLFMIPILHKIKATMGSEMEAQLFFVMVFTFLFHILTDTLTIFYREPGTVFPRWLCNTITVCDEISLLYVAFFWFLFCWVRLQLPYFQKMAVKIAISVPAVLAMILSITSPWTGLLFVIDEAGIYHRGPYYFLQVCAVFSYIVLIAAAAVYKALHVKSPSEKYKALSLIKFVAAPIAAGILQIISHNTPVMDLGLAFGIYFVYIDLLDMQVYNDSLTGLNNRRRAMYFLSDCMENASEKPFYAFMIDIDYFKQINDKYGHGEGDKALCIVAEALKETAGRYDGFTARLGGDEFVMSVSMNSGIVPEKLEEEINQKIRKGCEAQKVPYTIRLSVGFIKCDSHDASIVEVLQKADEMQYKKKRENHESK